MTRKISIDRKYMEPEAEYEVEVIATKDGVEFSKKTVIYYKFDKEAQVWDDHCNAAPDSTFLLTLMGARERVDELANLILAGPTQYDLENMPSTDDYEVIEKMGRDDL